MTETDTDASYGGLLGAFPYAFRTSSSRLFRLYVVLGGLLTAFVTLQFIIAVLVLLGNTASAQGGVFTFVRSFFIFVGFLVVLPLVGPIIYVARRHRRKGADLRYDRAMALAGFGYILALYIGLVISIPECFDFGDTVTCRDPPSGPLAPVVRVLYALPPVAGLAPPAIVGFVVVLVDRYVG